MEEERRFISLPTKSEFDYMVELFVDRKVNDQLDSLMPKALEEACKTKMQDIVTSVNFYKVIALVVSQVVKDALSRMTFSGSTTEEMIASIVLREIMLRESPQQVGDLARPYSDE